MGLETQIWLLDRRLRGAETADLKATAADEAVLATAAPARLAAFGRYMSEKVAGRFYADRAPATLLALARALEGDDAPAAAAVRALMATPHFERAVGEDVTGAALFGWVAATRERWPAWLWDLAGYEYLITTGLPRRARGDEVDLELEGRLVPQLRLLSPTDAAPGPGEVALAAPIALADFEYPAGELQEVFASGGRIEVEVEPEPQAAMFALLDDEVLELEACYPQADILQLAASPQAIDDLRAMFGEDGDEDGEVAELIAALLEAELLAGGA